MNLRSTFHFQQHLFVTAFCLAICGVEARAQAQQGIIKMKAGAPQQGIITGVTASGVGLQLPAGGSISIPLGQIESVSVAAPPEFNIAMQAVAAKDLPKANSVIAGIVTKFKGLPADWAQQATALSGFLALQSGDLAKAESAFRDFKTFYPAAPEGKVGTAAIAAAKKDFATAKSLVAPIIEDALKLKDVPLPNRFAFSRAFFISGLVKESENDFSGALEDYLRTSTIFYHDTAAVASAQERAEALRKNKITVP